MFQLRIELTIGHTEIIPPGTGIYPYLTLIAYHHLQFILIITHNFRSNNNSQTYSLLST